jgi:probable aminopeptidase NPEPL1
MSVVALDEKALDKLSFFSLSEFESNKSVNASANTEDIICVIDSSPQAFFENVASNSAACCALGLDSQSNLKMAQSAAKKCAAPGKDKGSSITCMLIVDAEQGTARSFTICCLPTACSRNNTPSKAHAVTTAVKASRGSGNLRIVILPSNPAATATAQAIAVARAFPIYNDKKDARKKLAGGEVSTVTVVVNVSSGASSEDALRMKEINHLASSIRLCAQLVDMPPNLLNCTTYTDAAVKLAEGLPYVATKVIKGKMLEELGFGGLYGVGKASEFPPALVILSHVPPGTENTKSIALVGKGIVYDTGGLSIKVPPGMAGMKSDMGGSAAVLMAFRSLVLQGDCKVPVHALLCIAENSVDERSTRPDDVHTMLSGLTTEINNTDAEGRLVLSDGVFYAHTNLNPKVIIDIATLTGAQLITTGKKHAAIYCNEPWLEDKAMSSGKYTGDLVFPMLYCPEFHREMFASQVADMKNSVSDRMNAQSSCAGQFIGNHLEEYLEKGGAWLHVDMAGPAMTANGDRATGYGVALLYDLVRNCQ